MNKELPDGSAYAVPGATGRWTQDGDSVRWDCAYPSRTTTFVGTISTNSMNGGVSGSSQSWSAERVGTASQESATSPNQVDQQSVIQPADQQPTATQGSGNSIVDKWTGHIESEITFRGKTENLGSLDYTVDYNRDGTYTQKYGTSETTGRWTQYGNTIRLQSSTGQGHFCDETINGDTMSGTDSAPDSATADGGVYSCSWSESRVTSG